MSPSSKRRGRIPLALAVVTVLFLALLCLPSDANELVSKKVKGYTNNLLTLLPVSKNAENGWDYYGRSGVIQVDRTKPLDKRVRYIHIDDLEGLVQQGKTGLESDVVLGDGFDELQKYRGLVDKRATDRNATLSQLSYLHNKTILFVGDSIDRFALDYICGGSLLSGTKTYRYLHSAGQDLGRIEAGKKGYDYFDEFSEPHRCALPSKHINGMEIWSLMIYGVTSEEDDWKHKDQTSFPRVYSAKIIKFKEAFDRIGKTPDLIIANSILWDLATANLRDAKAEVPSSERLSLAFIEEFKEKTQEFMNLLNELWPNAIKMYRKQHAMKATAGSWYLEGLHPMPQVIDREPYLPLKVLQLNSVIDALVEEKAQKGAAKLYAFDIRHSTQDFVRDFRDNVHLGEVGKIILSITVGWMLLYGALGETISACKNTEPSPPCKVEICYFRLSNEILLQTRSHCFDPYYIELKADEYADIVSEDLHRHFAEFVSLYCKTLNTR